MEAVGKLRKRKGNVTAAITHQRTVAQQRRMLENVEFEKLSAELPIARAISGQHIDKTSVVRLASTFIRLHECLNIVNANTQFYESTTANNVWNVSMLDVLDGFLICLSLNFDILYVSETISIHLGLSQVEMTGNSLTDYIHREDVSCLRSISSDPRVQSAGTAMLNIRMKSTLTKRANKDVMKCSAGYKVIQMETSLIQSVHCNCIVAFCQPLPVLIYTSIRLDSYSFAIIADVDLAIHYVDARCEQILRSTNSNRIIALKGSNFYHLVYHEDLAIIRKMHAEVLRLGASKTQLYRLIKSDCSSTVYVQSCAIRFSSNNKLCSDYITLITTLVQ